MARHLKESKAPDPIIEIHGVPVEIVTPNYAEGEFGDLARGLADELQMACDFFYKSPDLIKLHESIEINKLYQYFPDDEDARQHRWHHESSNLYGMFPSLQIAGNLFTVVAILELYVLQLALMVERTTSKRLTAIKRRSGLHGALEHLVACGVDNNVTMYEQTVAAIDIRNCLAHASGYLDFYRGKECLLQRIKTGSYLSAFHRDQPHLVASSPPNFVLVTQTEHGDRLRIESSYPQVLCVYFREFYLDLCNRASVAFTENQRQNATDS